MKSVRHLVIIVVLVVIALLLLAPVCGHHPYADFDNDKTIKIEGKVVQFMFVNPHLQIEDEQKKRWDVEWPARGILPLRMRGIRQDSLRYGDTVVITGNPTRDPAVHRIKVQTLRRSDGLFTWGNRK
jgi:hypothetical protein